MGSMYNSSVSGRKVSIPDVPACLRRSAATSLVLNVVLTKGLMRGGSSCGQGTALFLRVKMSVLTCVISNLDLDPSRPAESMCCHHFLCDRICGCRSPFKYRTNVVIEMSPCAAVVLSRNGELLSRARKRIKSMMPLDASCNRPCVASSFWRHVLLGGWSLKVDSHCSGKTMLSSVVSKEKSKSACDVVKGWSVGVKGNEVCPGRRRRGRPCCSAKCVLHSG